jgi:hypothetical protein
MSDRTTLRSAMTVQSMIFFLECAPLLLSPLTDPALGTDCRHDSAQKDQQDFAKNNPKICFLGQDKKMSRIMAVKRTFCKNKDREHHN